MSNQVNLIGSIESDFIHSHSLYGETFYVLTLSVKRQSGQADLLPLLVSDRLIDVNKPLIGQCVHVRGSFRSHNQHDADKDRVKMYVFVDEIKTLDTPTAHVNDIFLEGNLCKQPVYRHTPLGREIADAVLAVNRAHNNRADFISCILWGRNAYFGSTLKAGDRVRMAGRIQSRQYSKGGEVKTAYEVSVSLLEIC